MGEIWKDIKDWPFHQVSNLGRVRVLPGGRVKQRIVTETELRILTQNKNGYMAIERWDIQGRHRFYVHRLILNVFVGPCPDGQECRHLNGDKSDNRWPENLEWGTPKQNYEDQVRHGTVVDNSGERHGSSKLTESDVIAIRASQWSNRQLAIKYKVDYSAIWQIRSGRTWKQVDYHIPKYPPMYLIPDMESIEYPRMMLSFGS